MRGSSVLDLQAVHGKEWSEGEAVRGSREGCGEGSSSGVVWDLNRPELGSPWSGCRRGARAQASVLRGPGEAGEWSGRAALAGEQRGQRSGAAMPCPCRGSGASWGQQGRGARSRRSRVESAAFSSQGSGEEGSGRGHGGAKHGEHCSHAALRLQEEDEDALADSPLDFFFLFTTRSFSVSFTSF